MGFFGKILVLAAVIAIAWFGWRWLQRTEAPRLRRPRDAAPRVPESPAKPLDDMQRCPVCGDYVSINARRCERPTCPRG